MYRFNLKKARNSRVVQEALGVGPTDSRIPEYLNQAQETLVTGGDWWGTYQKARFCATKQCISLPPGIAAVRYLGVCGDDYPVQNSFMQFLSIVPKSEFDNCPPIALSDEGVYPTFEDVTEASYLMLSNYAANDVGQEVLIKGYDQYGIWIRTDYAGSLIDGKRLTVTSPTAYDTQQFKSIVSIQATDDRDGDIAVFAKDTDDTNERSIAVLNQDEENTNYRRYKFNGISACNCVDCPVTLDTIVKLNAVDVVNDYDEFLITSLEALALECRSILATESNNPILAAAHHKSALTELRNQLRHVNGDTISARIQPQGRVNLAAKGVGSMR